MRRPWIASLLLTAALAGGATWAAGDIASSAGDVRPLLIGAQVPELNFVDSSGAAVTGSKLFGEKPTILIVYRGGW